MAKRKKRKKNKRRKLKKKRILLPKDLERKILGILIFLAGVILALSLLGKAGGGGLLLKEGLNLLLGRAAFLVPLAFFVYPLFFLKRKEIRRLNDLTIAVAFLSFILLVSALIVVLDLQERGKIDGGKIGYLLAYLPLRLFNPLVTQIIILTLLFIDALVFSYFLKGFLSEREKPFLIKAPEEKEEKKELRPKRIFRIPKEIFRPIKKKVKELPSEPRVKEPMVRPLVLKYKSPPLNLLEKDKGGPLTGDTKENAEIIRQTLENFDIPVKMGQVNVGPTVTQYTLEPAPGIRLSKLTVLSNNLALALASHPIRIEAPIPGKSLVGIEVPNKKRALVRMRSLVQGLRFQKSFSPLTFVLGRDVAGGPVFADLAGMPHLLVAGSTGTGKTVCLNGIILSLLYQNSPKSLRLILVDPKRVEFVSYSDLPHLLCPVIYDAARTVNVLNWLVGEMERRFDLLSETGAKNIAGYNEIIAKIPQASGLRPQPIMPYIILIIDELADLMATQGKEVEAAIVRLAQMARAVGIHLVVATQRPSVEVLTGLIKANITSRISFQVASQVDSRTVLDMAGAEKLLGLGDLLFISSEVSKPKRAQGAFVSEKEIEQVVGWLKEKQGRLKEDELKVDMEKSLREKKGGLFFEGEDPLFEEAKKIVIHYQKGSASLLQRKLSIGYARAARLIDMLEREGIVGPPDGSKPREVYIDLIRDSDDYGG